MDICSNMVSLSHCKIQQVKSHFIHCTSHRSRDASEPLNLVKEGLASTQP